MELNAAQVAAAAVADPVVAVADPVAAAVVTLAKKAAAVSAAKPLSGL